MTEADLNHKQRFLITLVAMALQIIRELEPDRPDRRAELARNTADALLEMVKDHYWPVVSLAGRAALSAPSPAQPKGEKE